MGENLLGTVRWGFEYPKRTRSVSFSIHNLMPYIYKKGTLLKGKSKKLISSRVLNRLKYGGEGMEKYSYLSVKLIDLRLK